MSSNWERMQLPPSHKTITIARRKVDLKIEFMPCDFCKGTGLQNGVGPDTCDVCPESLGWQYTLGTVKRLIAEQRQVRFDTVTLQDELKFCLKELESDYYLDITTDLLVGSVGVPAVWWQRSTQWNARTGHNAPTRRIGVAMATNGDARFKDAKFNDENQDWTPEERYRETHVPEIGEHGCLYVYRREDANAVFTEEEALDFIAGGTVAIRGLIDAGDYTIAELDSQIAKSAEMLRQGQEVRAAVKTLRAIEARKPPEPIEPAKPMVVPKCAECGKDAYAEDEETETWYCKKHAHSRGLLAPPPKPDIDSIEGEEAGASGEARELPNAADNVIDRLGIHDPRGLSPGARRRMGM